MRLGTQRTINGRRAQLKSENDVKRIWRFLDGERPYTYFQPVPKQCRKRYKAEPQEKSELEVLRLGRANGLSREHVLALVDELKNSG